MFGRLRSAHDEEEKQKMQKNENQKCSGESNRRARYLGTPSVIGTLVLLLPDFHHAGLQFCI